MKTLWFVGLISLLLAACAPTPSPTPAPTKLVIVSSPTATATPRPTQTATATQPSQKTTVPTSTFAIVSTLTQAEREKYVTDLLMADGNCKLPCWWNITPGETTWNEAKQFLLGLGTRTNDVSLGISTTGHAVGGLDFEERRLYNRISFEEQRGVVQTISVQAEAHLNPSDFYQLWQAYSPRNILINYGQPSRVLLQSSQRPPADDADPKVGYGMWLLYDDLGFFVEYSGLAKLTPIYHVCPGFGDGDSLPSIKIYAQSSNKRARLETKIESYLLARSYFLSLEQATGMKVEQFYTLLTQPDQPACFDVPRDVWK